MSTPSTLSTSHIEIDNGCIDNGCIDNGCIDNGCIDLLPIPAFSSEDTIQELSDRPIIRITGSAFGREDWESELHHGGY
jgi:hypothetical protein